jgi:hypothetical protein
MNRLVTIIILLILSILGGIAAARPCIKALAAPPSGVIRFGMHMDFDTMDVYPARNRFPAGEAPFYAATFTHPTRGMHVTVALSLVRGVATYLAAAERDYMDYRTGTVMGWLPLSHLHPGTYVLTIRGHNTVLATGSFRVVPPQ